jgi:DNA invertase Pin-like site-specific DNA recombinase
MKAKAYSYIRFSTKEQEKGDSLRRQTEGTEEIANLLSLELDTTLRIDRGLSSFTGDNRTKGALGEFLRLVEQDKIAVGSCLIIEHFDRLTRQGMTEAIHLLTGILLKGIDLYTKMDKKHFTKDSFDAMDLITSAIILQQGHDESEKKRIRAREFWNDKRKEARSGIRKLTRECPMWLEYEGYWESDKKYITTGYKEIPERVKTIKKIFKMKKDGKGPEAIASKLNAMKDVWLPARLVKTGKQRKPGWYTSLVNLYLNDRKLIGELQPHRYTKVNGKRVNIPDGEPFQYYPPVIDKVLFNQVQKIISDNGKKDGRGGGRGDLVNNLFGQMAYCSICGSPMRYLNRGDEPQIRQFRCSKAMVGLCIMTNLHYIDVENTVLIYCNGLEVADILPNSKENDSDKSIIRNQIQAKEGEIPNIEVKINELVKRIENPNIPDYTKKILENKIETHGRNIEILNTELSKLNADYKELEGNGVQTEEQIKSIKELIDKMKDMTGEERLNLRLRLRTQLRLLISTIKINAKDRELIIYFKTAEAKILKLNVDGTATKILFRTLPRKPKKNM